MSDVVEAKKSGLAVASLVLGIIGIVFAFIPIVNYVGLILGILALVFGIIPLIKKCGNGKAIAGLVLGILAVIIALAMHCALSSAVDKTSKQVDKMIGKSTEEVLKNDANVTLGDFTATTDQYGVTNTKLTVTVKNITNEKKSFSIHIEAVNDAGERIDEDYVYANDLSAGQTQSFDTFTLVKSSDVDALKKANFKILEASAI